MIFDQKASLKILTFSHFINMGELFYGGWIFSRDPTPISCIKKYTLEATTNKLLEVGVRCLGALGAKSESLPSGHRVLKWSKIVQWRGKSVNWHFNFFLRSVVSTFGAPRRPQVRCLGALSKQQHQQTNKPLEQQQQQTELVQLSHMCDFHSNLLQFVLGWKS